MSKESAESSRASEGILDELKSRIKEAVKSNLPPEIQDVLDIISGNAMNVEKVYHMDEGTIDREALQEEQKTKTSYKELFASLILSRMEEDMDGKQPKLMDLQTFIDKFSESKKITVEGSNNVIWNKPWQNLENDSFLESANALLSLPRGAILVQSKNPEAGFLSNLKDPKTRLWLASKGVKTKIINAQTANFSATLEDNEIGILEVPHKVLPMDGENWNLKVLDAFVALYDKGSAIWNEPQILASVLVRKGMKPEDALTKAFLTPKTISQADYDSYLANLNKLTA